MPKFAFKLESILRLKAQLEENLKNELGKAIGKLETEKHLLSLIETEKYGTENEFRLMCEKGSKVQKIRDYTHYMEYLKQKAEQQKENIKIAQEIVDKYREELIAAMQERKMLENLKMKKFDEYMKEQNRKETNLVDELTSYKYAEIQKAD